MTAAQKRALREQLVGTPTTPPPASGATEAELKALEAAGISPTDVAVLTFTCSELQPMGMAPNGQPIMMMAFIAPLPATLLRPSSTILDASGRPIGGGLVAAIPLPPTVRVLCRLDALDPNVRAQLVPPVAPEAANGENDS